MSQGARMQMIARDRRLLVAGDRRQHAAVYHEAIRPSHRREMEG